jgi:hypothetical protein
LSQYLCSSCPTALALLVVIPINAPHRTAHQRTQ